MTGPEHYATAERLLRGAEALELEAAALYGGDAEPERNRLRGRAARITARALVHATLAQAAACYDALAEDAGSVTFGGADPPPGPEPEELAGAAL